MILLLKQRLALPRSLDRYTIHFEDESIAFLARQELSLKYRVDVCDAQDSYLGRIERSFSTLWPRYLIYMGATSIGAIEKKAGAMKPGFSFSFNGWDATGDIMGWDYQVVDANNLPVMTISKQPLNWGDAYKIDVIHPEDALVSVMIALAIDASATVR